MAAPRLPRQRPVNVPRATLKSGSTNGNKIAQGDVNIFSHLTFSPLHPLYIPKLTSNRQNNSKFVLCRSELVYVDTLLVRIRKFYFWRPFWIFFKNAVRYCVKTYRPILLIFNSKLWKTTVYLVFKFEENRSKIATVRVPERKNAKWPP